jgi:NAD(P)-dependent dehydrogenase (short-subunit alcohol dehydrogenase family)
VKVAGKVVVPTGAASGIGRAKVSRLVYAGGRMVVMTDVSERPDEAASEVEGVAMRLDATSQRQTRYRTTSATSDVGPSAGRNAGPAA